MSNRKTIHFTPAQYDAIVRLAGNLQADTGRVFSLADAVWEAARRTEIELNTK